MSEAPLTSWGGEDVDKGVQDAEIAVALARVAIRALLWFVSTFFSFAARLSPAGFFLDGAFLGGGGAGRGR